MADKFYFFCDLDGVAPQAPDKNFGPTATNPDTEFRVTSVHTIASPSNAYAITKGSVFVIPDAASPATKVNLILRPTEQPEKEGLPSVKYYVYKGILLTSLIDGVNIAADTSNELTASIWDSQRKRNDSADKASGAGSGTTNDSNSPPLKESILREIGTSFGGDTAVYNMFFKDEEGNEQLPTVEAGWHIGDFSPGEIGIEIITEQIGFEPDFTFISTLENKITATALPIIPNQAETFSHWNEKEKILNFLDPCAFFGSFYSTGLKAFKSGSKGGYQGDGIYAEILLPIFANKNRVYVDIRNEHEYSYNYYQNYSGFNTLAPQNNLYFEGNDSNGNELTFPEIDYNTFNNYNWPLLVVENTNITAPVSAEVLLQFAFPRMDNPNPIFVPVQGKLEKSKLGKILSKKEFKFLQFPLNNDITENVGVRTPNYTDNSAIELISTYVRIKFLREMPQCPPDRSAVPLQSFSTATSIRGFFDLDNVFTPFDMILPWGDSDLLDGINDNDSWVYFNEVYSDVLRTSGQSFLANSGIARDENGEITLFAFATHKIINSQTVNNARFSLVGKKSKVDKRRFLQRVAGSTNLVSNRFQLNFGNPAADPFVEFLGDVSEGEIKSFGSFNPKDFAFLTISAVDFQEMKDIIAGNTVTYTTPPFLPNYKVHLGLKLTSNGADNDGNLYYQYEFILRGYAHPDSGGGPDPTVIEVMEIDTGINYYRLHRTLTANQIAGLDPELKAPTKVGKGYSIDTLSPIAIPNPDGSAGTPVDIKKINCKVYLYRGEGITPHEFCDYMEYWRDNVQQVWNSTTNNGLVLTYDPHPTNPALGTWNRPYIVDASGVEVREASARQFDILDSNEVLLYVDMPGPISRSHINGDRRTGEMYYDRANPMLTYYENVQNTPAHEFGHLLGLGDRYVYFGRVDDPANDIGGGGTNHIVNPNQNKGATAVYLKPSEDADYGKRYNWIHNLMTLANNVPTTGMTDDPITEIEPTFLRYHEHLRPVPNVPNPNWLSFSEITVFVTPDQFQIILNHGKEDRCRWLFLKRFNAKREFKGTFVGVRNNGIASDDRFNGPTVGSNLKTYHEWQSGPPSAPEVDPNWNVNPNYSSTYNILDHDMEHRRLLQAGQIGSPERQTIDGYFSPYCGPPPKLPDGQPILDLNLTDIRTPERNKITYYELETGGNCFGQSGINNIRNQLNQILNVAQAFGSGTQGKIPLPGTSFTPAQNAQLTAVRLVIASVETDIGNIPGNSNSSVASFTTDKFSNIGSGDASNYGESLWNERRRSMGASDDPKIDARNISSGIPGAANVIGSRPYNDWMYAIGNPMHLPKDANGIKPSSQYQLIYDYYFNRRAIIDIMGENGV